MTVYSSKTSWGYECRKRDAARRRGGCWSTGGKRVDAVTPAGVEAARARQPAAPASAVFEGLGARLLQVWEASLTTMCAQASASWTR